MGLGDLVKSGLDATGATGLIGGSESKPTSNLKGFLSKFNSSKQLWVDTIDPLHTFDVEFAFWPNVGTGKPKKGFVDKALDALGGALMDAADNLTGGLVSSIMNDMKADLSELQQEFIDNNGFEKTTFLDYITRGNLMNEEDDMMDPQLILDFSYYIQNITLPQITTLDGGTVDTLVGSFPINGRIVKPSQNTIQLNFINTKVPIAERILYPWMREVTLPYWSYNTQPYTTADITISFDKHADFRYVFVGCRPSNIETLQPSNELGTPTRQVTFVFDYMIVTSELKSKKSTVDNLLDVGTSMLNDVGSSLGL